LVLLLMLLLRGSLVISERGEALLRHESRVGSHAEHRLNSAIAVIDAVDEFAPPSVHCIGNVTFLLLLR
jgi:hypothetical protein